MFPVYIVFVFHPPEKRWVEVLLYVKYIHWVVAVLASYT
jgi:hypothetical protein